MKITHALNFMRSATAPAISAGVMIANIIWNSRCTVSGNVLPCASAPSPSSVPTPSSPSAKNSRSPNSPQPCQSPLNAIE